MNIRDLIRARMSRIGGGASRVSPTRDPRMQSPGGGREIEMAARNQRIGSAPRPSGSRGVPGLPGMRFADDYASGLQTGIESNRLWNSADRGSHPAIEWSKGAAGIGQSSAQPLIDATHSALAAKGISKQNDKWTIGGRDLSSTAGRSGPAAQIPVAKPNIGASIASGVKNAIGLGNGQPSTSPPAPAPTTIGGGIRGAVEAALAEARKTAAPPPSSRDVIVDPIPQGPAPTRVTPQGRLPDTVPPGTVPTAPGRPANAPAGTAAPGDPAITALPGANAAPNGRDPVTGQPLPPPVIATPIGQTPGAAPTSSAMSSPAGPTGGPTGVVSGEGLMLGNAVGMDWSTLAPYEQTLQAEAAKWGVDPRILRSVIALESQGKADAQNPNSSSYGLLQIQREWHEQGAAELGYQIGTPEGDIGYFAALIAGKAPGQTLTGDPLSNAVEIMAGATAGGSPDYEAAYRNDIEVLMGTQGEPLIYNGEPVQPGSTGNSVDPANYPVTDQPVKKLGPYVPGTFVPPTPQAKANGTAGLPVGPHGLPIVEGGALLDPATGQPVPGNATPAPTTVRPPKTTGVVSPMTTPTPDQMTGVTQSGQVQQGDGLGIYAGPDADESWVTVMSPNGGVNGDYKQFVCDGPNGYYAQDGCCNGGGCNYQSTVDYFDPQSANQTVHPGYDIALEDGTPFYAPIDAVVLGTSDQPGGEGCISPATGGSYGPSATINNCNWAYDRGMALGGISDSDGSPIVLNLDHVDPIMAESMIGQQITAGTQLGVGLDKGHVHVEAHGYCADTGNNVILDPSLVMGGFYNSHSACEGISRPVSTQAADQGQAYMSDPAYAKLKAGYETSGATQTTSGYQPGEPGYYQSQEPAAAPAPAMPAPSAYDTGVQTQNTGQMVTDPETGRQYEVLADGTLRLIYDPAW